MKLCGQCSQSKPLTEFFGSTRLSDGYRSICKVCDLARNREWRAANRNRRNEGDRLRRMRRKLAVPPPSRPSWNTRVSEVRRIIDKAGSEVRRAISRGELARPESCQWCAVSGKRIYAAHRDYSRPLDVVWLCNSCHTRWDKAEPKAINS